MFVHLSLLVFYQSTTATAATMPATATLPAAFAAFMPTTAAATPTASAVATPTASAATTPTASAAMSAADVDLGKLRRYQYRRRMCTIFYDHFLSFTSWMMQNEEAFHTLR